MNQNRMFAPKILDNQMFDIDGNVLMTNCSNGSMRNSFNHEIIQNTLNRNQ